MKILAVCNLKGGTAKTTTAVFLAHAFSKMGENVVLVDADPQGSASKWAEIVEEGDGVWPVQYLSMPERTIHKRLRNYMPEGTTVVVIDTPPFEDHGGIVTSALRAADLAIISLAPTTMDFDRTIDIWDVIEDLEGVRDEPLKSHALLVKTVPNASSPKIISDALTERGHSVLNNHVPRREIIAQAYGAPVVNLGNYFDVALELRQAGF